MDANEESNKALASKYEVNGFPTIKIFKNGGKNIQDYRGPREADGIVEYLKKQAGPPSVEIKSTEDAGKIISDKKVFIVRYFIHLSEIIFSIFFLLLLWYPDIYMSFYFNRWVYLPSLLVKNLKTSRH